MRILVDTSVWIDHLHKPIDVLLPLLRAPDSILLHPFVLGEISLINSKKAELLFNELKNFTKLPLADDLELEEFIKDRNLKGIGIGLVDVYLLYASHIHRCKIFTHDKKLRMIALNLSLCFEP